MTAGRKGHNTPARTQARTQRDIKAKGRFGDHHSCRVLLVLGRRVTGGGWLPVGAVGCGDTSKSKQADGADGAKSEDVQQNGQTSTSTSTSLPERARPVGCEIHVHYTEGTLTDNYMCFPTSWTPTTYTEQRRSQTGNEKTLLPRYRRPTTRMLVPPRLRLFFSYRERRLNHLCIHRPGLAMSLAIGGPGRSTCHRHTASFVAPLANREPSGDSLALT